MVLALCFAGSVVELVMAEHHMTGSAVAVVRIVEVVVVVGIAAAVKGGEHSLAAAELEAEVVVVTDVVGPRLSS